jgi:hypothetical protein
MLSMLLYPRIIPITAWVINNPKKIKAKTIVKV